jgi:probable HAF family extracellular repeat protein
MPRHLLLILLAVSCLYTNLSTAHAASYTFTSLDVPFSGANATAAFGINDQGQIVGSYGDSSGGTHGFLYAASVFTPLDVPFSGANATIAFGINDQGQIVGSYNDLSGRHGFLYAAGVFTPLDVPFSGANATIAFGINDQGQIVGSYNDLSGLHGFLYAAGVFTPLDVPFSGTIATRASGINDQGQIVGFYIDSSGRAHGFLYTAGVFTPLEFPFSNPNATSNATVPFGINDYGQIVGAYTDPLATPPGTHGFLYVAGVFTPLDVPFSGALFTEAFGINNLGQIVGFYPDSSGGTHGFLATPQVIVVTIDIQPGSDPASINPKSNGKIPVAILTTDIFDATTVNASTVHFGAAGTEAAPVQVAVEDVNGDGRPDLLLTFNIQATGITCGATSASLTGETQSRQAIKGTDAIQTVGCK